MAESNEINEMFTFTDDSGAAGDSPDSGLSAPEVEESSTPAAPSAEEKIEEKVDEQAPTEEVVEAATTPVPPEVPVEVPGGEPTPAPTDAPQLPVDTAPAVTEEERIANIQASEARLSGEMTTLFQMSPEDLKLSEAEVESFATEPEKAIPAYMARVFPSYLARCALPLYYSTIFAVGQQLPTLINSINGDNTKRQGAIDGFFGEFPVFNRDDPNHLAALETIATAYKQRHPQATTQEIRTEVGKITQAYLGLSPAAAPAPAASAPAPAPAHKPPLPSSTSSQAPKGPNSVDEFFEQLM